MEASELRIGNWIIGAYPFQIEEIRKDGIYSIYEPIPLTPEILERFEFLKNKVWIDLIHTMRNPNNNELKYLHQLQNLYFALTGEELSCERIALQAL